MDNIIPDLYSLLHLRLDTIAEKILLSKVNDDDDVYLTMLSHVEDVFIQAALKISDNNISKAARLLGINRNTLSKKLRVSEKTKLQDQNTGSIQRRNAR
jgi:DNA-binding NtrC family response regulator